MQINWGLDNYLFYQQRKEEVVSWSSQEVINGHMLLVGKSGTGKTHRLRNIVKQLVAESERLNKKIRIHIIDVHGDIDIDNASTVKFSESTNYGFNPLLINPDEDFGGVRKRIQSFVSALNKTSRQLGTKQEACLRNILTDLYNANGFRETDPKTWKLDDGIQRKFPKKNPTLEDATKFAMYKLKGLFLGTDSRAVRALENLNKKQLALNAKRKKMSVSNGFDDENAQDEIEKLSQEAIDLYVEYIGSIKTGLELDDLIKYDSKDVMKSVVERLENLNAIGIFKTITPPFDEKNPIWRYVIKSLSMDEKKLFVYFRLEEIFYQSVQRGVQDDIVDIIILDEAHNFFTDDDDNIINTIAKEARKFGLALICASQSPTHFSDDFVSNVGTKIILGIDQMYWDGSVRKLKIDPKILEFITPHKTMALQINNKGELRAKFRQVLLKN